MPRYMAEFGLRVLQNGYNIIPIRPGEKRPAIDNWNKILTTLNDVEHWRVNGFAEAGIGITTGHVVGLDLDIPNVAVERVAQFCYDHFGIAPARVGNAPKLCLMYRTDTPFQSRSSKLYRDGRKQRCQIDALGKDRQFVAYHTHPDTGRPYVWDKGYSPLHIPMHELPLIRQADIQKLFDYFDQIAIEEGWTLQGSGQLTTQTAGDDDLRNPKKPPCGFSEDEIREILMSVPNDDKFESRGDWLQIGFAVHHETDGSPFGEELWREWSEQHHTHDDAAFNKAWNSFGTHGGDQHYAEVTFRYVQKIAKQIRLAELQKLVAGISLDIDVAETIDDLKKAATAISLIKDLERVDRETFASALQDKARKLGVKLSIATVRGMVRYQKYDIAVPAWLRNWVFLTHTGQFYSRSTGQYVDRGAFDAAFARNVPPDTTPTWFATRITPVPVYHMTMYLPGEAETFRDASGVEWINTYRDTSPPMPMELIDRDRRNLEIVQNHAIHLFGHGQERDVAILHSTLAYVVQTGKRVNWMTVIQGAEAIGKTFYFDLMATVLGGPPHAYKLDTETLTGSNFTEWAEGHQIVAIEELKIHGKRYDVINKMKPYVTDTTISIHPKGVRQYNAVNTTTYLAFTNHRDAVPLTEGDTRYFVLLCQWQDNEAVEEFKAENPLYYRRLFAALQESPGAVRRWLMEYELHNEFEPDARAPRSAGKATIIDEGKPELQTQIEDLISSSETAGVSRDLIVVHLLGDALADDTGVKPPHQTIRATLQRLQYTPIKNRRVKIAENGTYTDYYCWSKNPKIIAASTDEVRAIITSTILKPPKQAV